MVNMTADALITDPVLTSVLESANLSRQQALAMLDFLEQYDADPSQSSDDTSLELSKQQKLLNAYLAQLRGLNRKAIMRVRGTKQETAEARQEIDTLHLQLQNLYYEQRHLRGEIAACEDYDHTYTQLPLIPVDHFLAQHPEHVDASEHDLMVARIEHERQERLDLEEQRQALLARRDALMKERAEEKEELAKLDAEIEKVVASTEGVQKIFVEREMKMAEATARS